MASSTNQEAASFLEHLALLMELDGANPFRVRASAAAAAALAALEEDVVELLETNTLTSVRGIGRGLADLIAEFVRTGSAAQYEELRARVPTVLLELLQLPGVGPKRARLLHAELGVLSLDDLEQACLAGRLDQVRGFGERSRAQILEGIARLRAYAGSFLVSQAWAAADRVLAALQADRSFRRVALAGDLRRGCELVQGVEIVASGPDPEAAARILRGLPDAQAQPASAPGTVGVRLLGGLPVRVHQVAEESFAAPLHHWTGSPEHVAQVTAAARQRGLRLGPEGLFRGEEIVPCATEEDLFRALGLAPIPPELREGQGEVPSAARRALPELVTLADVRGLLHVHTTYSDGTASMEAMALAARERGFSYLGVADHSRSAAYAGGLDGEQVRRQHEEIDALNERLQGIHLFKGIESDVRADGSLDYEDAVLETFDFVVASVHSRFRMDRQTMTRRLVRAVEHPTTRVLGHLTGRLLLAREGYEVDVEAVLEAAARARVAVEVNAHPRRLDIDWRHLAQARRLGVVAAVNTDAHQIGELDNLRFGIQVARKGWLTAADVVNCLDTAGMAGFLARRG
ncbi:MAG: DNA polymerase/3'-5' exonuclease PolX [Candidatus Latescibacterota bacterium]